MKKYIFLAAAACISLAACNKTVEPSTAPKGEGAKVTITFDSKATKAEIQTADEAAVTSIQAFVFSAGSVDAYANATSTEIAAKEMTVSCTQGTRDIWVVVNAPSLAEVTTLAGLKAAVSNLTADNAAAKFVMVGKKDGESIGATYATSIAVDRIVSRVRLFQVKRDMANEALKTVDFEITRAYLTCVNDNACYDIFTPTWPETINWLNARFANGGAISTDNAFVYDKLATSAVLANGEIYGTLYGDATTVATHTFYTYPNQYSVREKEEGESYDQTKLVVECKIDGKFYTYPIPLGAISYNKTYDVKLLTITRLGNPSDGDDDVEDHEDDIISGATATFTVTVNDWTQVLTFGGVVEGEITI